MTAPDPLLTDAARGLGSSGRAHTDYLLYLFVQAVVVFVWWPKDTLFETLRDADTPDTLLAAVIAVAVTVGWYSARCGAEEVLLPGQSGLRDWAAATRVSVRRVVAGYLGGHLLQTGGLLALSLPLVLCAFTVSGGEWSALAACFAAALVQATFFRLAAAAIYLSIGRHGTATLIAVRALVVVTYVVTALALPAASHLRLSAALLRGDPGADPAGFAALYTLACIALLAVVHRQLTKVRDAAPAGAAAA